MGRKTTYTVVFRPTNIAVRAGVRLRAVPVATRRLGRNSDGRGALKDAA
jgi:hypothetical protein